MQSPPERNRNRKQQARIVSEGTFEVQGHHLYRRPRDCGIIATAAAYVSWASGQARSKKDRNRVGSREFDAAALAGFPTSY